MYLKLDLEGITLHLKISGYVAQRQRETYQDWCSIELLFVSPDWFNCSIDGSMLTSDEIDSLTDDLEELLSGELEEKKCIDFLEPDFCFELNPKSASNDDISLNLKVMFWNGCPTSSYLCLVMKRSEIEIFLLYLKLVTKRITKTDKAAEKLIREGTIS